MGNRWKQIWETKDVAEIKELPEFEAFKELKRADGFDVAVGNAQEYYQCFYKEWEKFFLKIGSLSGGIDSVYEIGCGSGVNLYMFANRKIASLGGVDYSESLVKNCRKIIDSDDVICGEAKDISANRKYDLVMSESVFQYFPDQNYAEIVLRKMMEKSNKIIYLGEIHDKRYEEDLVCKRRETIPDYDEKYVGLDKMFYEKEWIIGIAEEYGKKILFTDIDNPHYLNAPYCFNCYLY